MKDLPLLILDFFYWWAIGAPKKIFVVLKRILILINNEVSFTLNIRLLFTPLFGDYTRIGRLVGFVFRIFEIIFGSIFIIFLAIITAVVPALWWVLPVVIIYYLKVWSILIGAITLILYLFFKVNVPRRKLSQVKKDDFISAFRPSGLRHLGFFEKDTSQAFSKFFQNKDIQHFLKKAELLNNDFLHTLSHESSINVRNLAQKAYEYALSHKSYYIELEHLFVSILANTSNIERLLAKYGSSLEMCEQVMYWIVDDRNKLYRKFFWQEEYDIPKMRGFGKGMTGHVTPLLDSVSEDFTSLARKRILKKIIGREQEIEKIARILGGSRENVLIIGEAGSGKTAIVRGIAHKVVEGTKYASLKNKRIVSMQTGGLIAGAKTPGDLAKKLNAILKEIESSKDIILFIDEIHNLVSGVGKEESEVATIYSILQPHLSRKQIQFLAATDIKSYRKYIEPNSAFSRLFQIVEIPEASKKNTLEILKFVAGDIEVTQNVLISYPAIKKVIELSDKLIHERVLPDKALDILHRAVSSVEDNTRYVNSAVIAAQISEVTHVPVTTVSEDESEKLLNIEERMKKRVIGQDEAISQLGKALKRARVGVRNEEKPIASFLFVGTTGVGKTETAKTLAQIYFGSEKSIIRLDMSEYQQVDSINKLIGTPDGNTKGTLTDSVRTSPFNLILLDEVEKAYSSILLTFLQVLDDGRLTDTTGRVVDFTNTIIIATSNVGTRVMQEIGQEGGDFNEMSGGVMEEVHKHFAPEFLNRFNGIIVFRPLTQDNIKKIVELMLSRIKNMTEQKGVKVEFKPELISELAKRGYSPEWGARPLARVIENSVETYLAVKMLEKEIKQGDSVELGLEVFEE